MIKIPKSNYAVGRGKHRPEIVVIHISDGNAESVIQEFSGPTQKSSHYLVKKNGEIIQFVDEKDTAYGNGKIYKPTSKWVLNHKELNPNLYSISVEHEGKNQDAAEIQYETSAKLIKGICERWLIPVDDDHIIPHYAIRNDKVCPRPISVLKIINLIKQLSVKPIIPDPVKNQLDLIQQILNLMKKILSFLK